MKNFVVIGLVTILFACTSKPATSAGGAAGMDLDVAIREAAIQMETRIPSGTKVALVSVASPSTAFSTQILTRLESAIVGSGKLVVVDRANLDKVREEQGFQLSGEVDDESAKSIGRLLGAGAIVTGSLADLGDVYCLTLKAINIETATVAVSYLADLAKTTRIETLLATRDGSGVGGTEYIASASSNVTTTQAQQAVSSKPSTPAYRIGNTGPAGGFVFYDKGNNSGGWRYLEAAPANTEFTAQWGSVSAFDIETGTNVGSGKNNTQRVSTLLEQRGELTRAAHRATQLDINGHSDWFLPSKAELAFMYINLKERGLGDFGGGYYWSSSITMGVGLWNSVWAQRFSDGTEQGGMIHNMQQIYSVRAIRQF